MSVERAMKFQENLRTILDHYGFDAQLEILIEECAELIQAVQKFKRYGYSIDSADYYLNLMEELADVGVMADQIILAVGESTVIEIAEKKVERQLKRIIAEIAERSE